MKVIDLLNKIANGEEVPVYINIRGCEYRRASNHSIESYYKAENDVDWLDNQDIKLNDEIEILDEEDEFIDIEECFAGVELEYNENAPEYKINQLIKNQKKIIQALKENE